MEKAQNGWENFSDNDNIKIITLYKEIEAFKSESPLAGKLIINDSVDLTDWKDIFLTKVKVEDVSFEFSEGEFKNIQANVVVSDPVH